jgi:DNA-binding IclR family transcriptional regulator
MNPQTKTTTIKSQILQHLRAHPGSTSVQIHQATGLPLKQVRVSVGGLMVAGAIQSSGSKRGKTYRLSVGQHNPENMRTNRAHTTPICASTMPNGDTAFWARHTAQMNTPARRELNQ